jgi:hypothetical protein
MGFAAAIYQVRGRYMPQQSRFLSPQIVPAFKAPVAGNAALYRASWVQTGVVTSFGET